MAESELGVLSSQCLDRRIPDKHIQIEEIAAWEDSRNKNQTKADWQFTTADARVKLKRNAPRPGQGPLVPRPDLAEPPSGRPNAQSPND
jgi:hypothetical protein